MLSNLILYRSLTQTQKASSALEREGIPNRVIRTPRTIAGDGCSHCVRLSQRDLFRALAFLTDLDLSPQRIYVTAGDGNFEEVRL
jgi:hypothetical protein